MVEPLGAIVAPDVPLVGGVAFGAGAGYWAAAVAAIAPNVALNKVFRIL